MRRAEPFPERAGFFWAFIFNRWKHNRKRTRILSADYTPTIGVVIPALNEAENLPHVLPFVPLWINEIVLVDGHSSDGTVAVARELVPSIRIVQQSGRGKGAALRSGFAAATSDIIVMLDADGSTDPREIPFYVSALLNGADFAKGSRFAQGGGTADMPLYRKAGNWCFVMLVRLLFGGSYTDLCYGYNAFWADVLPTLNLDGDGFEIETIMNVRALRANLKVVEVPSFEDRRRYGEGRLRTIPDGWRVLKAIFREWLKPPRRFVRRIEVRTGSSHQGTAADEVARLARDIEVEAS
jgi:glycosyltransferase involved in cell wall biosynthesis